MQPTKQSEGSEVPVLRKTTVERECCWYTMHKTGNEGCVQTQFPRNWQRTWCNKCRRVIIGCCHFLDVAVAPIVSIGCNNKQGIPNDMPVATLPVAWKQRFPPEGTMRVVCCSELNEWDFCVYAEQQTTPYFLSSSSSFTYLPIDRPFEKENAIQFKRFPQIRFWIRQ